MSPDIGLSQDLGYLRIGAGIPTLKVADVEFNIRSIIDLIKKAQQEGVQVICFPEMSITGYTLGDLGTTSSPAKRSREGTRRNTGRKPKYSMIVIVGMPLYSGAKSL